MSSLSSHPESRRACTVGIACSPYHRAQPGDGGGDDDDDDDADYDDDDDPDEIDFDADKVHLTGDAVGPLAEGALEDVHIVLNHSPARAVWGLKPVVLSFLF